MCYDFGTLAIKGPPPPTLRPPGPPPKGPKAKSAPKARYQRPMQVNTDEEERAAFERHHEAELDEERKKHIDPDVDGEAFKLNEDEHDEQRVQGIDWDERRKKKGRHPGEQDDEEEDEDGEEAAEAAKAAKEKGLVGADGAGRYFQDVPADRLGDPALTHPEEMKRVLGASVRYAQHAMLLAQTKMEEGMGRASAIGYLADLYAQLSDREYARKALKAFGPATGILDLYPLEVVDHLLAHVPSFFTNVKRGRFFTSSASSHYEAKAGETIHLSYPPDLKIRGFAIRDGARPGYLLEPTDPKGTYALTFQSAGRFDVLVSAIGKGGALLIEEMVFEIEPGDDVAFEETTAIKRERAAEAEAARAEAQEEPKKPLEEDLRIHLKQRI